MASPRIVSDRSLLLLRCCVRGGCTPGGDFSFYMAWCVLLWVVGQGSLLVSP